MCAHSRLNTHTRIHTHTHAIQCVTCTTPKVYKCVATAAVAASALAATTCKQEMIRFVCMSVLSWIYRCVFAFSEYSCNFVFRLRRFALFISLPVSPSLSIQPGIRLKQRIESVLSPTLMLTATTSKYTNATPHTTRAQPKNNKFKNQTKSTKFACE